MTGNTPTTPRSLARRSLAALIIAVAATGVILQYRVTSAMPDLSAAMPTWWRLAGYFTILTNLGIACLMLVEGAGHRLSARLAGGMVLSIMMVGLIYHLILARLWSPTGLGWWADQALHSAVPGLVLLWGLIFAARTVTLRDLPFWLIWPAVYAAYALIRGALTGFWPYPFLDADNLGWPAVALTSAILFAPFAVLGLGLVALARRSVR